MFPKLKEVILNLSTDSILQSRRDTLQYLIDFIQEKRNQQEKVNLHFICTHNSRRSHLAQAWAQVMADHFSIDQVYCYSGGTIETAIFPTILETLAQSGFKITLSTRGLNPIYRLTYSANKPPIIGFSKKWDNAFNPKNKFAAILTCSQADEHCPLIPGAEKRVSLPFEDPKTYDGHPHQSSKYKEISLEIATELYYVFSKII